MKHNTHATNTSLNELIEVLNDGVKFYDDAASTTKNSQFKNVFQRMADGKRRIASALKGQVAVRGGEPTDGGTFAGSVRQAYTDIAAKLSSTPDTKYVSQLEQSEDRILHAFQDALSTSEQTEVRQLAQNHLPELRRMHDEMRDLKQQLKPAA
jgi:uncharacterized protein (TIGR02284 family)